MIQEKRVIQDLFTLWKLGRAGVSSVNRPYGKWVAGGSLATRSCHSR